MIAIRAIRPFRANVMDTLGEDYVRTARAKGAPEPQVMREPRAVERPASDRDDAGNGHRDRSGRGAIFTEALESFDLPMIQGVVVFSTLCIIVFSVIVDVAYAFIYPRIRLT